MYIQFAELPVTDQDRAIRFYADRLGCTVAADAPMDEDGWRWVELALPGAETHLHFVRAAGQPAEIPVLVFVVDDAAVTAATLADAGVEIVSAPHTPAWEPGRTVAEFRDSEGNRIVLSSAKAAP